MTEEFICQLKLRLQDCKDDFWPGFQDDVKSNQPAMFPTCSSTSTSCVSSSARPRLSQISFCCNWFGVQQSSFQVFCWVGADSCCFQHAPFGKIVRFSKHSSLLQLGSFSAQPGNKAHPVPHLRIGSSWECIPRCHRPSFPDTFAELRGYAVRCYVLPSVFEGVVMKWHGYTDL